ncbi:DNA polymerase III delta prime subunit [Scopulibacillus darangshiensis]|uniref:DNA polymerase III delta prime subunit n=1 Tax=Scopulibacillus darangshiensis TaxID=442528 RepID=A0A4V6NQH0_9BACL|nr:DNA polymerase III subunit delta' [Scopulibacillus darangshiensis]TCP22566.1 DNA polymerase III delta prime subunit [Scopulibacillus darangshiensis]
MSWKELAQTQATAARILTNALTQGQLAHAYLIEGQKGTGKRKAAKLLSQSFFCQNKEGAEPCGHCRDCRRVNSGNHPDVVWVKPDGQSIKKEQVSNLIKEFSYRGVESRRKIFIIEQADHMTIQAANSLLKFIEEPNGETIAVLMTEQMQQLLDTIISRCQILTFRPLSRQQMEEQLVAKELPRPLARLSAALTNDIEDALEYCSNEWFAEARQKVIQFMEELINQSQSVLLKIYGSFSPHFDDQSKMDIGLDLILLWYKDLMSLHLERMDDIIYIDQLDLLNRQALKSSLQQVTDDMSSVLSAKKRLSAHVNQQSVMEQLVLMLQGGVSNEL